MQTRKVLVAGAVALTVAIAGCGSSSGGASPSRTVDPNRAEVTPPGDIPDDQAFVAYSPPHGGYSVKVPEGWARTVVGGAVTFTDKLNAIRMESHAASAPPSVSSARRVEVPAVSRSTKGFRLGTVSSVRRTSGAAIRITYRGEGPPDPVTGKVLTDDIERYVFFHKGKEVVLTLSGPKGADNVDPWKLVTDSLRFTR